MASSSDNNVLNKMPKEFRSAPNDEELLDLLVHNNHVLDTFDKSLMEIDPKTVHGCKFYKDQDTTYYFLAKRPQGNKRYWGRSISNAEKIRDEERKQLGSKGNASVTLGLFKEDWSEWVIKEYKLNQETDMVLYGVRKLQVHDNVAEEARPIKVAKVISGDQIVKSVTVQGSVQEKLGKDLDNVQVQKTVSNDDDDSLPLLKESWVPNVSDGQDLLYASNSLDELLPSQVDEVQHLSDNATNLDDGQAQTDDTTLPACNDNFSDSDLKEFLDELP